MSSADYVAKYPRRRALREKVENFWIDEAKRPAWNLDSSLKKHTTLLNRLKTLLLIGPAETLIKEIDGLTLSKYLEEIAGAVVEGASKGKGDTDIAVEVIVHLHTRLTPDFFPLLLPPLLAALVPSPSVKDVEKEDKERIARQRSVLRIVSELAIISAWPEGATKGASEVGKILKALMTNDPQYTNLPLITTFLKSFHRLYLGAKPDGANSKADEPLPEGIEELVPVEIQAKMRDLFATYFNSAGKTLVKGQVKLLEQDKRNHEAYIKSGEIFEDRQQAYEKMTRAVERLTTGVNSLADLLGLDPPVLPTAASLSKSGLQIIEGQSSFTVRDDGPVAGGIWDDEEEKRFYEDILDLKQVVPAGLLGIKESKNAQDDHQRDEITGDTDRTQERQKQDEEDIRRQLEQMDLEKPEGAEQQPEVEALARTATHSPVGSPAPGQSATLQDEPEPTPTLDSIAADEDGLQSGPAARLNALLAALPEAINREMIDKLAVEFTSLNSKGARKRLIKFIGAVPKDRTDLLPHYGRFLATLDPYMPDVGAGVIEILDEEMRYLQRKRHVRELDGVRLKNVRFFGELAKFKVARPYTILHVLKVFLDEFKWNIENIANLLENCGRFLLRFEGTAKTAKSMVELMRRKQATSHLDARHNVMIENAFYMCNPPERVAREIIELTPMQSFIQHILHHVLMKKTLDKVLKLVRKLHWENPEVYGYILSSFTEIWEIKFGNIPFLAGIVYDLQRYHPDFSVAVVDQVMEDIRVGMEENIFKYNQRRISTVKYLGELYMYRVINGAVIFDVLWSFITYGHGEGLPVPGRDSPVDAVDDFFRVRLICTLLDTCGQCFDKGSQRRKLDHFLIIFQLYVVCKTDIPMDVEFMLNDTLDVSDAATASREDIDVSQTVRPKSKHLRTFPEAAAAVDELLATEGLDGEESATEDGSEGEGERGGQAEADEEEEPAPATALDSSDNGQPQPEGEEVDDDVVFRDPKKDEVDQEAQTEFDREFAKMLADTTDVRRGERKNAAPIFDTAVPQYRRKGAEEPAAPAPSNGMAFKLLSKRGKLANLDIPLDSAIAMNSLAHQQRNKAEQEQLKRLVLQNERRQGQSELQSIEQDSRARGVKWRVIPP